MIGKDIARFHALIWPCMLHHAKVRCPDRLLIHGFLTSEGEKMSKSLGNVVAPDEAIGKYGVDALRFYLSHEIPVGNDGDFSWKRFGELYDSALRNTIGNLLNRVLVMLQKSGGQVVFAADQSWTVGDDWNTYTTALNSFDVHKAVQHVVGMAKVGNQKFNDAQPWKMEPAAQLSTLSAFAEFLRHLSLMLLPVMPETAQKIARQLGVPYADDMLQNSFVITDAHRAWGGIRNWTTVGQPSILFVPVEPAPVS